MKIIIKIVWWAAVAAVFLAMAVAMWAWTSFEY